MVFNKNLSPSSFELQKRQAISELQNKNCDILDLSISSPMQAGISLDISDDLHYLAQHPEWQFYAPDACGQKYAREAIAKIENCDPDSIFITSSSSEAYSTLFQVFCDKGDCILTPNPGYPLIDTIAELAGLKTHPYFLKPKFDAGKWRIDLDSFDSFPENAKILLVIAPHNPTGHSPSETEWNYIFDFCEKHKLVLAVDEVFKDYKFLDEKTPFASQTKCSNIGLNCAMEKNIANANFPIFFLNGLSKSAGLPHIKVGWMRAVVPKEKKEKIYNAIEYVLDSQLNCSYASQAIAARVLPRMAEFQKQVLERLKINLDIIAKYFSKMGAKVIPSLGGWYQAAYFESEDDIEISLSLLKEKRILTHPGFLFDFKDGWLVMSLLQEPARLVQFF